MPLIHNTKDSLFGGVNQQAAEFRQSTQVEEMINAFPTIDKGLLKRNPTVRVDLNEDIVFTDDIWTYEYQRGFAGGSNERYAVNITNSGAMEIVNVDSGRVYKEGLFNSDGKELLSYENGSRAYLYPFIGSNGYAATTIKDTTFLVNKNKTPTMDNLIYDEEQPPDIEDYPYVLIELKENPDREWTGILAGYPSNQASYAPSIITETAYPNGLSIMPKKTVFGSETTIIIDSNEPIRISVDKVDNSYADETESTIEWYERIEREIRIGLGSNQGEYTVERAGEYGSASTGYPPLRITKWDKTASDISVSISISFNPPSVDSGASLLGTIESVQSDYIGDITQHIHSASFYPVQIDYKNNGFIWIKRSDPSGSGYTYSYSVTDSLGHAASGSVTETTTDKAAKKIAEHINDPSNPQTNGIFSAVDSGSVVKINSDDVGAFIERVDAGDSYGNQASFGWAGEVTVASDLPKNLGFSGSIVRVVGNSNNAFAAYWLTYSDGQWRESIDPEVMVRINPSSMPHVLVKNINDTFTFKQYEGWIDRAVGDNKTNKVPSFIASDENRAPVIKDIFFFKNRLGFMTARTVVLSEVGKYGNFFRTTVSAVLDSDRIDAAVDTTKAIELEYATYLEDSVMLFADIQFRFQGGSVLSPTNVQISQTSAYEINRKVRPVFMNDRVFFCVKRGRHTAVMEYFISESASSKSEANDITAHCQTYIPSDVTKITGSAVNNMLFIKCSSEPSLLYVYKYYDSGNTRVQSAWFKWRFNGTVYNAFSFGEKVNLMIARVENTAVSDWVLGTGIWDGTKLWRGDHVWVSSPAALSSANHFEQMDIAPLDFRSTEFIDDNKFEEDRANVSSYLIDDTVSSGQVLSRKDFKVYLTSDARVVFKHSIETGEITYKVKVNNGDEYSTTVDSASESSIEMIIPLTFNREIIEITVTPRYGERTTATVNFPAIYQGEIEGNLLPSLNNYGWYVDDVSMPEDTTVDNLGSWFKMFGMKQVGSVIPALIRIGEWVYESGGKKETRGHLKFKTVQVNAEEGGTFSLMVEDVKRGTRRTIKSEYTVGRKPMVYGDAKNIRVSIASDDARGFRINAVSFEGNFNIRSRRN